MNRSTRPEDIEHTLISLDKAGIPFTYTLLIGGPGETPETITETFDRLENLPKPSFHWITIGLQLWTEHQSVVAAARRDGQLQVDMDLFDVPCYISPELPKDYMLNLIEAIGKRENSYYCLFKSNA